MLASYVTIPQAWDGVPTRDAVSFLVGLRSVRASNAVYLVPSRASSDLMTNPRRTLPLRPFRAPGRTAPGRKGLGRRDRRAVRRRRGLASPFPRAPLSYKGAAESVLWGT